MGISPQMVDGTGGTIVTSCRTSPVEATSVLTSVYGAGNVIVAQAVAIVHQAIAVVILTVTIFKGHAKPAAVRTPSPGDSPGGSNPPRISHRRQCHEWEATRTRYLDRSAPGSYPRCGNENRRNSLDTQFAG